MLLQIYCILYPNEYAILSDSSNATNLTVKLRQLEHRSIFQQQMIECKKKYIN